jgi:thiol-disulfide isomerase/thioredoxin
MVAKKAKTLNAKKKNNVSLKNTKKGKKNVSLSNILSKHDNIDVRTIEDVDKLVEHIKDNVVTLLLIYADWCGHCKTFKSDVWEKLAALKGRKVGIAQLNETQLANTPLSGLKIDGYPTVSLIGKDMKAATLKDPGTGESTNALPNTRDMTAMTNLVTADPSQVMANNGMSSEEEPDHNAPSESAKPTAESAKALKEAGNNALENLNNGMSNIPSEMHSASVPNPPNVEDDLVSTATPSAIAVNKTKNNTATVGGSLYASLLEATREIAVPALLATAVAMKTRRAARGAGTKKLRGRGRR